MLRSLISGGAGEKGKAKAEEANGGGGSYCPVGDRKLNVEEIFSLSLSLSLSLLTHTHTFCTTFSLVCYCLQFLLRPQAQPCLFH